MKFVFMFSFQRFAFLQLHAIGVVIYVNRLLCLDVCSYHDTVIVLVAMGITAVVCLSVTIFAIQTKVSRPAFTLIQRSP